MAIKARFLPYIRQGARCTECALYEHDKAGPVPSAVVEGSGIVFVGEAPGPHEVEQGQNFVGPSGHYFNETLRAAGKARSRLTIINAAACKPNDEANKFLNRLGGTNRERQAKGLQPLLSPWVACAPRVKRDIAQSRDERGVTIVPIGAKAHESIANAYGYKIGKSRSAKSDKTLSEVSLQRGHPAELRPNVITLPTLHPAFALRSDRAYLDAIRDDIIRAFEIRDRGHYIVEPSSKRYLYHDTPGNGTAFIDLIRRWVHKALATNPDIICDIETNGIDVDSIIRCIGLGYRHPNGKMTTMVVPLRSKGGAFYFSQPQLKTVRLLLNKLFVDAKSVWFHNAPFDMWHLQREKFLPLDFKPDCTQLLHHDTRESTMPHKLANVSSRVLEIRLWKDDVDLKSADTKTSDHKLHTYNAEDCEVTIIVKESMERWAERDGTVEQYEADKRLLPIAVDMGKRTGMWVHEPTRLELSSRLHNELDKLRSTLSSYVGKPDFNPRSANQMTEFLFKRKGLTPVLATTGYEMRTGDKPAISIPAMFALMDLGMEQDLYQWLETWVMFKSLEQLRARIDNFKLYPSEFGDDFKRIFINFNLHVVPSGRWSSQPNLQNIPKLGWINMRQMFVAPPGHVLVSADFEQLEARLYAVVAQDKDFLEAIAKGLDIHSLNYARIETSNLKDREALYKQLIAWKSGTPAEKDKVAFFRLLMKKWFFGTVYGMRPKKSHAQLVGDRNKATGERPFKHIKLSDCARWYKQIHEAGYIKAYHKRCDDMVRELGYVTAGLELGGRKRFFHNGLTSENDHKNHPIQAKAGQLTNDAIEYINARIPHGSWSPYTGLCNQVHDDIIAVVPEDQAGEAKRIFSEAMNSDFQGVPIEAFPEVQKHWTKVIG